MDICALSKTIPGARKRESETWEGDVEGRGCDGAQPGWFGLLATRLDVLAVG